MSYRNQLRIKTYRALKKFECFIHIFNLVYPQLAPSYIVKKKIIITLLAYICMHHTISKLSLFPLPLFLLHVTLTIALFSKAVNSLDF